jgi:hypothetical protein
MTGRADQEACRKFYNAHFLTVEFFLAICLTVAVGAAGAWIPAAHTLWTDLEGQDPTLYSTLAVLAGTLLGFLITGLAIIVAIGPISALQLLSDSGQRGTVWTVFAQAMGWLAVTTVWSLIGLVLSPQSPVGAMVGVDECFLVILSGAGVLRTVWVLRHMVRAALLPVPDTSIHE